MCPSRCDISYVLYFFAGLFDEGHQCNTIWLHGSASLAFHDPLQGIKVGDHQKVYDLISGVFHQRPPQPQYTFIWDVEVGQKFARKQSSIE